MYKAQLTHWHGEGLPTAVAVKTLKGKISAIMNMHGVCVKNRLWLYLFILHMHSKHQICMTNYHERFDTVVMISILKELGAGYHVALITSDKTNTPNTEVTIPNLLAEHHEWYYGDVVGRAAHYHTRFHI